MKGNLVLMWKKGEESHSLVRGKEKTFHHFVAQGRVGKKMETLPAKEGVALIVQVMDDPACEVDPGLAYELCQCLMSSPQEYPAEERKIDCGRQAHRCLPIEEEEERQYFNLVSHHQLSGTREH
jgi:hypothetical protein